VRRRPATSRSYAGCRATKGLAIGGEGRSEGVGAGPRQVSGDGDTESSPARPPHTRSDWTIPSEDQLEKLGKRKRVMVRIVRG
jgi:hypothetical protein